MARQRKRDNRIKVTYANGQTALFSANHFQRRKRYRNEPKPQLKVNRPHPYWPEWIWDGKWFVARGSSTTTGEEPS